MAIRDMRDADLLNAINEYDPTETDWFDHGGEIAADFNGALLDEAERRGLMSFGQ